MQKTAIVVIHCDGRFEMDAKRNYTYVDGRTKAKLMHTNCTYNELLEIAYKAASLNPNQFRIKMKFIEVEGHKILLYMNVNDSEIRNEDYSIPHNKIEENIAFNLNNEEDITVADRVLPTIDEYDRLYNLYNYDLEYDDNTNVIMQEDNIALDEDIELDNDIIRGDDEVNGTFEVPIEANYDAHFVSDQCRMIVFPFHIFEMKVIRKQHE
ncbi:hypothetical protein FNV43_RR02640 [Rhamnella rubrinervis]|uniref:Uncharacterized protein n=1 Tax=Rhamnella rubrinervis TaxID=2594499 RepID=A0A8K0HTU4_9ROSA|nr:hypothetical protein FNV43_RR02640 [Rhamnella rubrinervis]